VGRHRLRRFAFRVLFALAVLPGTAGAQAARSPPPLTLELHDAATGKPVSDVRCGLVDAASGEVYARFRGVRYAGARAPAAGDLLFVYRRGYDLLEVTLARGARPVRAALRPVTDAFDLVVGGEAAAGVRFRVHLVHRVLGRRLTNPVRDAPVIEARGPRVRLALPRGMRTSVTVESDDGIVWPFNFWAAPGGVQRLGWEPPRKVALRIDADVAPFGASSIECLEDRLWDPAVSRGHVDAWRFRLTWPDWLDDQIVARPAAIAVSPDVPFHLFAVLDGRPVYRFVTRGDDVLDLRRPFRVARVAARPQVDGEPVPEASILAPGRLDAFTLLTVASGAHALRNCCRTLGPPDEPWTAVSLPASAWLTVWRPGLGVAHLRWRAGQRPAGESYPGTLVVRSPPGHSARGVVSIWPIWRGRGLTTIPALGRLRRDLDGRGTARFRGLHPGHWALLAEAVLTAPEPGSTEIPAARTLEFDVTKDRPAATLTLRPDPD